MDRHWYTLRVINYHKFLTTRVANGCTFCFLHMFYGGSWPPFSFGSADPGSPHESPWAKTIVAIVNHPESTWKKLLVGGLEHEWIMTFHMLGIIIPSDSYFSEGLKPPTTLVSPMNLYMWDHVSACSSHALWEGIALYCAQKMSLHQIRWRAKENNNNKPIKRFKHVG